ncbi:MAG: RNA polymerase sigma factor [Planctomycetota bacterium]|jgi:RNA polymerase sigma-70 factor (ECF subfamily)
MKEEPDSHIVERVLGGDVDAYGVLVRRYQGMAVTYVAHRLQSWHAVEDVVQRAFVRAYEQLAQFDTDAQFGPWLRTICWYFILDERNRAVDDLRNKASYRAQLQTRLLEEAKRQYPETTTDGNDHVAALRRCIGRLPDHSRELLLLRYDLSLGLTEIAARLGRSETWVSTTLFRIRATLKRCVEESLAARR